VAAEYPGTVPNFSGMIGTSTDPLSAPNHVTLEQKQADEIVAIATKGVGPRVEYTSNFWYAPSGAYSVGNAQQAVGELRLFRQDFPPGTTVTGLGINIPATAGTAGATYTLLIYTDSGNYPNSLQKATSALDVTTTGIKSETFTAENVGGVRWLGALCLTNGAAIPSGITSGVSGVGASTITNANNVWTGYNQTGLGSAPATFTSTRSPINGIARVFFQIG
jgi:hypothetical protein